MGKMHCLCGLYGHDLTYSLFGLTSHGFGLTGVFPIEVGIGSKGKGLKINGKGLGSFSIVGLLDCWIVGN